MSKRDYPDLTDILARKAAGRRERARLSFMEKLAVLDRLRAAADQLKQARSNWSPTTAHQSED